MAGLRCSFILSKPRQRYHQKARLVPQVTVMRVPERSRGYRNISVALLYTGV
jgi:hypothetical protein